MHPLSRLPLKQYGWINQRGRPKKQFCGFRGQKRKTHSQTPSKHQGKRNKGKQEDMTGRHDKNLDASFCLARVREARSVSLVISPHFCMKDNTRIDTSEDGITTYLKTRSFLINKRLQATHPKRKIRTTFILLLAPSRIVS